MKGIKGICLFVSFTLAFCPALIAAQISWTNTSGGNWSSLANWSPNQLPGSGDDAIITSSGSYRVELDGSTTVSGLTIGGSTGSQQLVISGATLNVAGQTLIERSGAVSIITVFVSPPELPRDGALSASRTILLDGLLSLQGGSVVAGTGLLEVGTAGRMNADYASHFALPIQNAGSITFG